MRHRTLDRAYPQAARDLVWCAALFCTFRPTCDLQVATSAPLPHSSRMHAVAIPTTSAERIALVVREVETRLGPAVAATYMQTRNFALGG